MNGITVGTRRDQLLALRRRITTELVMLGHRETGPSLVRDEDPADPLVLVPLSHVQAASIRAWSGAPGRRGTLPAATVEQYTTAHRPWSTSARAAS